MGLLKQNRCKMRCETLMWNFELPNLSKEAVPRNFSQFPCQISAFCTQGQLLNRGEILRCQALKQMIFIKIQKLRKGGNIPCLPREFLGVLLELQPPFCLQG